MESALLTECPHVRQLCNPEAIQNLSRAAAAVFSSANRPLVGAIGHEGVPRCMHPNCRFPAARNLFVCVHCVHVACHHHRHQSSSSSLLSLQQQQSSSSSSSQKKKTNTATPSPHYHHYNHHHYNYHQHQQHHQHQKVQKSHLLVHHVQNPGHCIFLSVDHAHLYCAVCDDFVFNQFLDAAIALHSTRAKARRARFTSSLSAYDPPVCVEYDAALPMSVAVASATGQFAHGGGGGGMVAGGGSLSTAVLSSSNSKSAKLSSLKNGKQISLSPSSSSSLTTSPTNTTTTTTTTKVVKKPRRLFTHDAQWASTDAEVRSIATYATPFPMVKAVRGPVGLFNLGNSCYMNSVLQAFLNAPPLRNFFLADLHGTSCKLRHSSNNNNNHNNNHNNNNTSNNNYSNHSNNNLSSSSSSSSSSYHPQCFACAIERLVCDSCFVLEARAFAREKGGPVSFLPVPFLVPHTVLDIIWRNFSHLATYAQHDAHEFFMAALNLLSEHCPRDPVSSSSSSTATAATTAAAVVPASTVVKKEKNEPVLVELKLRKSSHHLNSSNNNNNDMDVDTDRDTATKAAGTTGEYQSAAAAAAGSSDGGAGATKKSQQSPPAPTSIVQSLFSGTSQSDVICRVCGNSSSKLEKFSDIQLHVDKPGRAVTVSRRGRSASSGGGGDGGGSGNGMSGGGRSHGGSSGRNRYDGKNRSSWSSSGGDMDPSNGHSDNTGDHHHHHHHHHHNSGYGNHNNQHTNGKDYNNNNSHNHHNNNNNNNNSYSNNNSNNHNNHCNPNGKDYTNSLRECLNRYTEPELLGVGDEMFCSSCNCKQEAMKQMSIRTLPPIVCFHFKRFKQSFANSRRSEMVKIDTAVEFPVDGLDLSPFQTAEILHRRQLQQQQQQQQQQQNDPSVNKNRHSKDSGINPNTSDTAAIAASTGGSLKKSNKANNHNNNHNHSNNNANQYQQHQYANSVGKKRSFAHMDVRENDQAIYDLFAVVNHVGKIDSGHYTALVRREGAWYRCDDEKITQVKDIQKVVRSEEAYLVFYVQRCVNLQFSESHL